MKVIPYVVSALLFGTSVSFAAAPNHIPTQSASPVIETEHKASLPVEGKQMNKQSGDSEVAAVRGNGSGGCRSRRC